MTLDKTEETPRTMPPSSPNGELVPINPQKLTPASKRSVRNVAIVWVISLVFIAGALHFYDSRTRGAAACQAKRFAYDKIVVGWTIDAEPMPTAGFSGETLRSRQLANAVRVARLKAKIKQAGPEPEC